MVLMDSNGSIDPPKQRRTGLFPQMRASHPGAQKRRDEANPNFLLIAKSHLCENTWWNTKKVPVIVILFLKMERKEQVKKRLKDFLSDTSFHPYPHVLGHGMLRRGCWTILGLACNAFLFAAVMFLFIDFQESPTKISSSVGKFFSCILTVNFQSP